MPATSSFIVALFNTTVQSVDEIHVRCYHDFVVEELSSFTACSAQLENLRVCEREVAASFNGFLFARFRPEHLCCEGVLFHVVAYYDFGFEEMQVVRRKFAGHH